MNPDQLSNTAAFIAIKFYGLTRSDPFRSLFDESVIRFYERLVYNMPAPLRYYHTGLKSKTLRLFFTFWEELLLPGDLMHIILRKYYLSRWVDELQQQGYQQMLVLGAGFDHLATMSAASGVRSVELDTPKMVNLKRKFITASGYEQKNLLLREAFFTRDSLQQILETTPLDSSAKTIIVTEGFFDYFNRSDCSRFLNDLHSFFSNEITLLSTIFSLQELSRLRSAVYKNSIKLAGEQLKLHLSQPEYLQFLADHGFKMKRCVSYKEMEHKILAPREINLPVLPGFYLVETKASSPHSGKQNEEELQT